METLAWRHVLGQAKVKLEDQLILSVVAAQRYSYDGAQKTMDLLAVLSVYLDKGHDAVDRRLRQLENILLRQSMNEDRGNVHHWNLKDRAVAAAVAKFAELRLVISKVVALQADNPDDLEIGKELLPAGVYFNVAANRAERLAAHQAEGEEK
jgi:hypothetical protein